MICPMRLIDSDGQIRRYYNPQLDERLAGCEERLQIRAHQLWEQAGCPQDQSINFWLQAKEQIENETSNLKRFFPEPKFDSHGDLIVT